MEVRDIAPLLLETPAGVEGALVLGLSGDNVPDPLLVKVRDPLNGEVVGLGGAGGEDDLFGGGANEGGDLGAGVLDGALGVPSVLVGFGVGVSVGSDLWGDFGVFCVWGSWVR